jgi:Holliday junction resolvasome RuvABC endonuclease subunit
LNLDIVMERLLVSNRILALDISTKTGFAVLDVQDGSYKLIDCGTLPKESEPKGNVGIYPVNYLIWADICFNHIFKIIQQYNPDEFVIEETAKGSKNNMSQKILEFIHYKMAKYFDDNDFNNCHYPRTYLKTEEWRRICGCCMTNEEKRQNKEIRKQRKNGTKVCKGLDGKRIGKIGKKHVNVNRANEVFKLNLKLKDEDRADALLLAYALYLKKL